MRHIASISRVLPAKGALPLWKPGAFTPGPFRGWPGVCLPCRGHGARRAHRDAGKGAFHLIRPHGHLPLKGKARQHANGASPHSHTTRPPQAPAAVAQAAKGQCGDFAEDCFRASGNSKQSSATEPPRITAARPVPKGARGSGGKRNRFPPAALRRFRRAKAAPKQQTKPTQL